MEDKTDPDLRELLRRAICEFIEPMVISHLSKDTEWREEANKFIMEVAPLVFGPNESVFGQKARTPRPSSVSCPVCKAPVGRACVQDVWIPPLGGNTRSKSHPERRHAAEVYFPPCPSKVPGTGS